jgi:hypothetical protein
MGLHVTWPKLCSRQFGTWMYYLWDKVYLIGQWLGSHFVAGQTETTRTSGHHLNAPYIVPSALKVNANPPPTLLCSKFNVVSLNSDPWRVHKFDEPFFVKISILGLCGTCLFGASIFFQPSTNEDPISRAPSKDCMFVYGSAYFTAKGRCLKSKRKYNLHSAIFCV